MSLSPEPVVLLVDNKTRDLPAASLIAHQLRALGVECYLEPLEAFRSVLGAYRPGMIIFNHLFASHLAEWSRQLSDMGVLVGVLSNEGMFLREDDLAFNSGRYHSNAHVDFFFCWNRVHRNELLRINAFPDAKIEVIGIPRFDFYFEPWSKLIRNTDPMERVRPKVLACTNFGLSRFWDLPREHGDRFFAGWAHLPLYRDYWSAIESHWRSRRRFLEYITPLIKSGKYDLVLRPHPAEERTFYERWLNTLSSNDRGRVAYEPNANISSLILDCDLEISGESCTTAVESWIVRKPTLELLFDKHPMLYSEERSAGNIHCGEPTNIVDVVEQQLANPIQPELRALQAKYLEKWCSTPDGGACYKLANIVAVAVKSKQPANWKKLKLVDRRRAIKLHATRLLGEAYHFSPLLPLKRLFKGRYAIRQHAYDKSIKPRDVAAARARIESHIASQNSG